MCCLADVSLRLPVPAGLIIKSISPRPSGVRQLDEKGKRHPFRLDKV
jgi:hypothetical protein